MKNVIKKAVFSLYKIPSPVTSFIAGIAISAAINILTGNGDYSDKKIIFLGCTAGTLAVLAFFLLFFQMLSSHLHTKYPAWESFIIGRNEGVHNECPDDSSWSGFMEKCIMLQAISSEKKSDNSEIQDTLAEDEKKLLHPCKRGTIFFVAMTSVLVFLTSIVLSVFCFTTP